MFRVINIYHDGKLIARDTVHEGMMQTLFVPMPDGRQLMVGPTLVGFFQPIVSEDKISISYEVEKE
ncbi:hypothetical protein LCGC14_1391350 [marine sediment metagenome]|uniref:Uncharacterized protein n=1 Tax=marine sediment metagenome TaxID=412755 RepID=A0A0F9K045_9ZZZZ